MFEFLLLSIGAYFLLLLFITFIVLPPVTTKSCPRCAGSIRRARGFNYTYITNIFTSLLFKTVRYSCGRCGWKGYKIWKRFG